MVDMATANTATGAGSEVCCVTEHQQRAVTVCFFHTHLLLLVALPMFTPTSAATSD